MNDITWLHLSDLHLHIENNADDFDRDEVLKTFFEDLKNQISDKHLEFDCIFFSGDIAFSGKKDEYNLAITGFFDRLLGITSVPKNRLFIVPGNHDVDWTKMDRIVTAGMREALKTRRDVNEFLRPGKDRNREFSKFDAYARFIRDYFDGAIEFNHDKFYYTTTFDIHGCKFAVLGLNTAWMSACYQNETGKPQDKGKLLIGDIQLRQALNDTDGADIRIVILHHPLDWLDEEIERFEMERQLQAKCEFVLHGHWHNAQFYYKGSNAGESIFIPAGALYQGYERPNGYNFVKVDLDSGLGSITFRRFHYDGAQGPVWMKDIVVTGEKRDGVIEFSIPGKKSNNVVLRSLGAGVADPVARPSLKKILVAEDGKNWQSLLKRILSPDYNVDIASTYNEIKSNLNNSYDAIVVNLCLEGDSDYLGEAVLDHIKRMQNPIPCIVMTGSQMQVRGIFDRYPFVLEVFTKGSKDEKSFPSAKFLAVVAKAVESGQ